VGGTSLYFHALQTGLANLPEADTAVREEIEHRAGVDGWPALHAELQQLDPAAAARIRENDSQRIQRALEVCYLSGEKISELQQETQPHFSARYLNIGLMPENRSILHEQIERRFGVMMEAGFLEEVESLLELPQMTSNTASMRAVGYRQLCGHISGELTLSQAEHDAVVATRRLAKRQLTWMRRNSYLHRVDSQLNSVEDEVLSLIGKYTDVSATGSISD
jgi:tRNA dimethylallyltransferase